MATRKVRAKELLERLERGPMSLQEGKLVEAGNAYRIWVNSWILEEIKDLIPELKHLVNGPSKTI